MVKETIIKTTKINRLMQNTPKGLVLLSSWLASTGYSYELQQRYRTGGWLRSIGKGAMIKTGDALVLSGAIAALQKQANLNVHIGGRSALEMLGIAHYLQLNDEEITVFVANQSSLPMWFTKTMWDKKVKIFNASLFHYIEVGLVDYKDGELTMKISNAARAVMECLSLCPNLFSLTEAYELMDGLSTLHPVQIQSVLANCKSIKAKRLFLYFAEKAGHNWSFYLNREEIDLGTGVRSLANEGAYDSKYQLVLPKELVK
jgi:hypothetical protein